MHSNSSANQRKAVEVVTLPATVIAMGRSFLRLIASLALAFVSTLSALAMVTLVDSHVPNDPMVIGDYYPFSKVVLCMTVSGISGSASILLAIPILLTRNITPTLWLGPLILGGVLFLNWYDWEGLFHYGKAWPETVQNAPLK